MSEKEQEMIMKLMKVFVKPIGDDTPIDYDKPTLMVSFKVIPSEKGKIVREDVRVANMGTAYRYYGKTPIVFIRIENIKSVEVLTLANMVKKTLENENKVPHERSIKGAIKNILRGKNVFLKKFVFYGAMGDIMLKRPHKDYVAFTNAMLNGIIEVE